MSREPDFQQLFRSAPGLYLVMRPDRTIVDASEGYRRATLTWQEEIRGCSMFDVFPDNPDDPSAHAVRNLDRSLGVATTGVEDRMALQKYDVPDRLGGGGWAEKYWLPVNRPVFGTGSREVIHIIHQVTEVTEAVRLRRWIDEQELMNAEQRSSLKRMQHDLALRRRGIEDAKRRLRASLVDGDAVEDVCDFLKINLNAPELREDFFPGEPAPFNGVYRVHHLSRACPGHPARVVAAAGDLLPFCASCGDHVQYRLIRQLREM